MDFLAADALPWLGVPQARIRRAAAAGRMPHSLLVQSIGGLGSENLAQWAAAFALCDGWRGGALENVRQNMHQDVDEGHSASPAERDGAAAPRPCGSCASCLLLRADTHPDLTILRIEEDARQIKIDQVRALIEWLELKSYRGGYKVGVIEGAEALNAHGANAFLKTLEEPTQNTLLILIAKPAHRLPATIASRCLRLNLHAPAPEAARQWLTARAESTQVAAAWEAALPLVGGAPLAAVQFDPERIKRLDEEMRADVERLRANSADITVLAEQWARSEPLLRLAWLENWITSRVHAGLGTATSAQTAGRARLPAALLKAKIRSLFELLDAVREFQRFASTGMNQQLALEALLLSGRAAFAA
jgi:DNA polymerase-3 subunit delta'